MLVPRNMKFFEVGMLDAGSCLTLLRPGFFLLSKSGGGSIRPEHFGS